MQRHDIGDGFAVIAVVALIAMLVNRPGGPDLINSLAETFQRAAGASIGATLTGSPSPAAPAEPNPPGVGGGSGLPGQPGAGAGGGAGGGGGGSY